jgi:hypothetical protein
MARTPVGEEDPLLYVGSVNGERRVDTVTSSVLDRMRAVLRTIDAEEVQATVAIPHDKEEYFEEKPPVHTSLLFTFGYSKYSGRCAGTFRKYSHASHGETSSCCNKE